MTVGKPKRTSKHCSPLRRTAIEELKGWAVALTLLAVFFLIRGYWQ